jgi:transposase-like protein
MDHIEILCPRCGTDIVIGWPTPRARHAQVKCKRCERDFSVAEAVERAIIGKKLDHRDLHLVAEGKD